MFGPVRSALATPDLRKKILFTLGIVAVYRLGATLPAPGVSYTNVQSCLRQVQGGDAASVYSLINLFSGGALLQLSIFALGIMPYITSSIIFQLLAVVIPRLEALKKEGGAGQQKITQYTRYLTIVLAIMQSTAFVTMAISGQLFPGSSGRRQLLPNRDRPHNRGRSTLHVLHQLLPVRARLAVRATRHLQGPPCCLQRRQRPAVGGLCGDAVTGELASLNHHRLVLSQQAFTARQL